jgi:hypothetical protein
VGTSQSSTGPGPGVALVPPWADEVPPDNPPDPNPDNTLEEPDPNRPQEAPPARFRDTRRSLGSYARSGNNQDLRRALGHYVRSGYGGTANMTRRLSGTAVTAGRLGTMFQTGQTPDGTSLRDAALANGNDANAVLDAIVDAASPADGTQDKEASRHSIRNALSDLLARFPGADLFALTELQRNYLIERYAALDVYARFCLDLQKSVLDKAPDAVTGMRRLRHIREFISEQVSASFRRIRDSNASPTTRSIAQLARSALRETMAVFEEYTS